MKLVMGRFPAKAMLRGCLAILAATQPGLDGQQIAPTLTRELPAHAAVERVQQVSPGGQAIAVPVMIEAPFREPGPPDVAFVYRKDQELVLRVARQNGDVVAETRLPGTYVQRWSGAPYGISVRRLAANSGLLILVATSEGASAGTYLLVFALRDGTLQSLTGQPLDGDDFLLECPSASDACRIITSGRWTDHSSAWVHVYEWSGAGFAQTDRDVRRYELERLSRLAQEAGSAAAVTPAARIAIAAVVVPEYLDRRQFVPAEQACSDLLKRLDDPASSRPRSSGASPAPEPTPDGSLALDIQSAQADAHELRGRVFAASGRSREAREEFGLALAIRPR